MADKGMAYLLTTVGLFIVFVAIVVRTYSRKRKATMEQAKYRMLDED